MSPTTESQSNSDQPMVVSPRLGLASLGCLALLLLASLAYFIDYVRLSAGDTTPYSEVDHFMLVGLLYGWSGSSVWLLSIIDRRYLRWSLQLAVVLVFAQGLFQIGEGGRLRYLSATGMLVYLQALMFHLLNVPRWRKSTPAHGADLTPVAPRIHQFGIGELIATTAVLGGFFAMVREYQTPNGSILEYWIPLIALWWLLPLIAVSVTRSVLRPRSLASALAWLLGSFCSAALCAGALSVTQIWLVSRTADLIADSYWELAQWLATGYGTILLTHVAIFACVAIIGRLQHFLDTSQSRETKTEHQGLGSASE